MEVLQDVISFEPGKILLAGELPEGKVIATQVHKWEMSLPSELLLKTFSTTLGPEPAAPTDRQDRLCDAILFPSGIYA